jgi:hypothetical protein
MIPGAKLLEPATKAVALVSLLLAVVYESWLGRAGWGNLPVLTASAAAAGLIGGRLAPLRTSAVILFSNCGSVGSASSICSSGAGR